jgi:hypothetical protein
VQRLPDGELEREALGRQRRDLGSIAPAFHPPRDRLRNRRRGSGLDGQGR